MSDSFLSGYIQNNMSGVQGASVTAEVTMNFGELSIRVKNKLIKAIKTNILESYGGQVAFLHYFFRSTNYWPQPHRWGTGKYDTVSLQLTLDQYVEIEPILLLMYPSDYYKVEYAGGWSAVRRKSSDAPPPGQVQKANALLLEYLRKYDPRDRDSVEHALNIIETGKSITIREPI